MKVLSFNQILLWHCSYNIFFLIIIYMVAKLSIQKHLMKGFIIIPSGPAQPQAGT